MSTYTPTRRNNSCIICGDITGKCREAEATRLCMTIADEFSASEIPGYKFIGQTKDGLWGKFVEDNGQKWTEEQRQEWRRQQELKRRQREAQEAKQRAEALPPAERDRLYCKLLDQLTLHPADRADLKRRGLSDQEIKQGNFKSVEQWQQLEAELSHYLPGVNLSGLNLNTQPGYLCPVKDVDGLIVGCQIRLRDADEGGRYRWLTSVTKKRANGPSPHVLSELPLAVHRPEAVKLTAIGMAEGVGVKPFVASQRLGQIVVGAAGGQFAASPQTLKTTIEKLSASLSTKTIDFYVDAGAVSNAQVARQYKTTWELLQEWGYQVTLGWWGQVDKTDADIDELTDYDAIAHISPDEFLAMTPNYRDSSKRDVEIDRDVWKARFGFPDWLKSKFPRISKPFKGFGARPQSKKSLVKSINYLPGELPTLTEYVAMGSPKIIFAPGQRLELLQEAVAKEYHDILDASPPGTHKTTDAGIATPEAFNVKKLWYFTQQSRNPATFSIEENFTPLPVRHNGFVIDSDRKTPSGAPHLRWPQGSEKADTTGNCFRTKEFRALAAKNVPNIEGSMNPICGDCHLLGACQQGAATGANFRGKRREALAHDRIAANLQSAPLPSEFKDYASNGAFIDESMQNLNPMHSLTIDWSNYSQSMDCLEQALPSVHAALKPLRDILSPILRRQVKEPYYGFSDSEVVEMLSDIGAIAEVIRLIIDWENNLRDLNFLEQGLDGIDNMKSVDKSLRSAAKFASKALRHESYKDKSSQLDSVAVRWLASFLQIWQRTDGDWQFGSFRIKNGELTLYWRDRRHADLAKAMKWVCYQDATATPEQLALVQDIDSRTILHIQHQPPDYSNLRIVQVIGLGLLGKQRSDSAERKVESLKRALAQKHPGLGIIDWKSPQHTEFKEGCWFGDTRSTNRYATAPGLSSFGLPFPNLGELQALYQTLTGVRVSLDKDKSDERFQEFVDFHVQSEIVQTAGRTRSHLRPDEQIPYYFVGDYDLGFLKEAFPGALVEQIKASDITLDVCDTMERNLLGILRGLNTTAAQGVKQTQAAISQVSNLTQGQVSKILARVGGLDRLKKLFQTLYINPIEFGIISEVPPDEQFLAREFLKLALQEYQETGEPEQLVVEAVRIIEAYGWETWRRMITALSGEVHIALSAQIVRLLPDEWRQQLANLIEQGGEEWSKS